MESLNPEEQQDDSVQSAIDSSVIESLRSGPRSPPLFSSSPTAVHATINNTMNAAAMSDNRPSVRSSVGSDGGGGSLSESPHKLQHPSSQQSLQSAGDDGRRMGPRYAAASELSQWSETSSYGIRENRRCRQQNQFSQQQQQQQYGSTMTYASKIGAQDNFSFLLNGDEMLPTHSQQSQCMLMHAQQRHPHTNASSLQSSLDDDGAPCNSLRDHEQNADDLTDAMLLSGLMNEQLDGDDIDEIVAAAGDLTDVMLLNGLMDHQLDGDDVDEMVAAVETSPAVSFYHASFNNNSNSGASGGSNSQQHQQQQEQEYVLGSEGITGGSPANGSIAGRRPGRGFESLSVADALPKDLFDLTDSANASLEHLDLCNDDCSAPEISEADVIADGQPCAAALPRVFDSDLAEPPGSVATESAQPVVSFANSAADPDISKVALRNILDTVFTSQYGDYSDDIQATRIIGLIQATPRNTVNSGLVPLQPASSSSGVNVNVVNQPQINYSAAQAAMQIFWQGINTPPTSQSSTSSSSSPSSSSSSSLPSSSLPSASLPSASLPSSSSSSASSSLTSSSLPSSSSSTTWILDNGVGIPGLENGTVVVVANPGTDFAAESAETREDTEIIDLTYDTDDEDLAFCKKPEVKVEEADRSELHINNDDDDNDVSETCRGRRRKRRQILDSSGRGGGSPQAPGSQAGRGKPGPGPLGRSNGGNGQDDMPAAFGGRAIGGTDKPGNNGDRQNERLAGSAMKAAGLSGARGQDCFPRALRLRTPGGPGKQGTARTIQHQSNKERSVGPSRPAGSATAGHPGGTIASEDVKSSANKDKGVGPCSGRRPRDSGASRTRRRRSPSPPSSSGRHSPSRPQRRISGTQKRPQESKASRGAAFGQPRPGEARCNASPAAKHAGPDDAPGASGAKRARTKPVSRDHALNIAGKSVTQTSHSSEPIVGGKISILQNLTKRIITSAKVAFSRSQAAVSQADAESFSCGICQKRFGGKAKLTIHIRRHTGVKPYVCQHCAKAFVSWGELADHKELKHAVGQPYQCSRCHKKFKAKSLLRAHARVHSDARPFRCAVPECTSAFKASSALHAHTATVHKGERNFPCELCESRFKTKAVLSAHVVQTHTSERPFKCGLCPQAFKAKSTLKEHVQTRHGDARPYPCTRCARAFKTRSALHCHTATVHSEDRPFPCDQCKAAFKTKAARNEHAIMKHSTKRPLKCPLCRQKFKTLGTLNGHMLCHSEERPFGCNLCASAFKRTSELNRHTATIHSSEDRPFACEECPATFKRKAELNKHVIRKHTTD